MTPLTFPRLHPRRLARAGGLAVLLCLAGPLIGRASAGDPPTFVRAIGSPAPMGTLNDPLGVAFAPAQGNLVYVVDQGNARIQVFSPEGEVVGMWGQRGEAPGGFWGPSDIAVSADGSIAYVVDRRHRRVMQFAPTSGCLPGGTGRCFVTDWGGWGIGPGQLQDPTGIALGPDGRVYVADRGAHDVEVFNGDGSYHRTIGSYGHGSGELLHPTDVDFSPDGQLWVADRDNDRIAIFSADGGPETPFKAGGRLHYPTGIAFGPDGSFVVLDYEPDYERARAWLFGPDRKPVREELLGGDGNKTGHPFRGGAQLPDGHAVLTLPDGQDFSLILLPRQGDARPVAERGHGLDHLVSPRAVAVDGDLLAVLDSGNRRVLVFDHQQGNRLVGMLGDMRPEFDFSDPRGVAIQRGQAPDAGVVVFVADPGRNQVYRGTPSGERLESWGGGPPSEALDGFDRPCDVAVGPDGAVYIADTGNDRIVRRAADGRVLNLIGRSGLGRGELRRPAAVAVSPEGSVYVLEQAGSRLQAFTPEGALEALWPCPDIRDTSPGSLWRPVDLAADAHGLYVLENEISEELGGEHMRVQVFQPRPDQPLVEGLTTIFADVPGAALGQLWDPRGLGVAPEGWVALADTGNHRVQLFRWPGGQDNLPPTIGPLTATPLPTELPPPTALPPPPTGLPPPSTAVPPTATPLPPPADTPVPSPTDTVVPPPTDTPIPTALPAGPTPLPTQPSVAPPTPTATLAPATVAPTVVPTDPPPPSPTLATPFSDRQPVPSPRRSIYLPFALL